MTSQNEKKTSFSRRWKDEAASLKARVDGSFEKRGEQVNTFGDRVLTPHNIPKFIIPKSLDSLSTCSKNDGYATTHFKTSTNSLGCLDFETTPHCKFSPPAFFSTPVSPCLSDHSSYKPKVGSFTSLTSVDEDEQDSGNMGLNYLKTKTCYGLQTLAERPHTNRKESLYLDMPEGLLGRRTKCKVRSHSECQVPKGISLLESIPARSCELPTEFSTSPDETLYPMNNNSPRLGRPSKSYSVDGGDLLKLPWPQQEHHSNRFSVSSEIANFYLNISCTYLAEASCLRIIVHETAGPEESDGNDGMKLTLKMSLLSKVSLMPQSKTVGSSDKTEFNFEGMTLSQAKNSQLKIELFEEFVNCEESTFLVSQLVGMASCDFDGTKFWVKCNDTNHNELGTVVIRGSFLAERRKLELTVASVTDLPADQLLGFPDVFVKATLSQRYRFDTKRQTQTQTGRNLTFNETFTFNIAAKNDGLAKSKLALQVCVQRPTEKPKIIGQVLFGRENVGKAEEQFWGYLSSRQGELCDGIFAIEDVDLQKGSQFFVSIEK